MTTVNSIDLCQTSNSRKLRTDGVGIEVLIFHVRLSLFTAHCSLPSGAGNFYAGFVDGYLEELERLGRWAADVGAGAGIVDTAVAGAVDAVHLGLVLDRAAEVGADGGESDPGVVGVVDEHGGGGAEFKHEHGAGGELVRVLERDLGDGCGAGGHLCGRGEIAVDGVAEGGDVTEAGGSSGDKETASGGGFADGLGGRLGFFEDDVSGHYAAPFIECGAMGGWIGFWARATTEMSQATTPRLATKRMRKRPTTLQLVTTARSQTS